MLRLRLRATASEIWLAASQYTVPSGKYAKTAYEVLAAYSSCTLLKVRLFTGRTHQIRVHLASIGHPLVNDNLYGTPGPQARHALHAYRLAFKHPVSDVFLEITRALPEDLQKLLY